MSAKPKVVFVDDSKAELDLFEEVFGQDFDLVLGQSAEEALEKLSGTTPDLILLDVYIPVDGKDRAVPEDVAKAILELPPDKGELKEAYNNMLEATKRFQELQQVRAHGVQGGLKLARTFVEELPHTPLIGYSRKSSPLECLAYLATIRTAVDFVQKPNDPRGWNETRELTKQEYPRLRDLFLDSIRYRRGDKGSPATILLGAVDFLAYQAKAQDLQD